MVNGQSNRNDSQLALSDLMLMDVLDSGRDDWFDIGYFANAVRRYQIPVGQQWTAFFGLVSITLTAELAIPGTLTASGFVAWDGVQSEWLDRIYREYSNVNVADIGLQNIGVDGFWFSNTPEGDRIGAQFAPIAAQRLSDKWLAILTDDDVDHKALQAIGQELAELGESGSKAILELMVGADEERYILLRWLGESYVPREQLVALARELLISGTAIEQATAMRILGRHKYQGVKAIAEAWLEFTDELRPAAATYYLAQTTLADDQDSLGMEPASGL